MVELDLKARVYGACREARTGKEIADKLGETQATVTKCLIELREEGRVEDVKDGGPTKHQALVGDGGLMEKLETGGWV